MEEQERMAPGSTQEGTAREVGLQIHGNAMISPGAYGSTSVCTTTKRQRGESQYEQILRVERMLAKRLEGGAPRGKNDLRKQGLQERPTSASSMGSASPHAKNAKKTEYQLPRIYGDDPRRRDGRYGKTQYHECGTTTGTRSQAEENKKDALRHYSRDSRG